MSRYRDPQPPVVENYTIVYYLMWFINRKLHNVMQRVRLQNNIFEFLFCHPTWSYCHLGHGLEPPTMHPPPHTHFTHTNFF